MSGIRSLEETLKTLNKELAKADVELQPLYRTQIGNILTKIGELAAEIVNVKSEVTEVKENKSDDFSYFKKAISQDISQIPEFFGNNISETEKFISKLEQLFQLLVVDTDKSLEAFFLNCTFRRLSQSVYKTMISSKISVKTYEEFKNFVQKTFGGQLNCFQQVSRIFDIPYVAGEKFHIYTGKLSDELRMANSSIREHFKPVNGENEVTSEQCLDFFGALIFAEKLKGSNFHIFKDLTTDFDTLTTCNAVAQRAEYFRERLSGAPLSESTLLTRNVTPLNNVKPRVETRKKGKEWPKKSSNLENKKKQDNESESNANSSTESTNYTEKSPSIFNQGTPFQ